MPDNNKCEECGGTMVADEDNPTKTKCFGCARPAPPVYTSYEDMLAQLTPQRDAVLGDIANLGAMTARRKYRILSRHWWARLSEAWDIITSPGPDRSEKYKEFDKHTQEILADSTKMSGAALELKWHMCEGTWPYLRKKWESRGITVPAAFDGRSKEAIELVAKTPTPKQEEKPPEEVKPEEAKIPTPAEAYFDQHRDEILADRLVIGQGLTLAKWKISHTVWLELKPRWVKGGVVVEDLRRTSGRFAAGEAKARIEVEKKQTGEARVPVLRHRHKRIIRVPREYYEEHKDEMLADYNSMIIREFIPKWHISTKFWQRLKKEWGVKGKGYKWQRYQGHQLKTGRTPTVREEVGKTLKGKEKEFLRADDKIEITVGRLEELFRELEHLKGYREAVQDIFRNGHKDKKDVYEEAKATSPGSIQKEP